MTMMMMIMQLRHLVGDVINELGARNDDGHENSSIYEGLSVGLSGSLSVRMASIAGRTCLQLQITDVTN